MKDLPDVIRTLQELVSIDSVNPAFGGPGEAGMVDFVEGFFEGEGIEVIRDPVFPGRDNLVVRIPGRGQERPLLLEAHVDTVSAEGMEIEPVASEVREGRLYGRGACDVKGGLAAMMHAVVELARAGGGQRDVFFAAVVDEEDAFRGAIGLIRWLEKGGIRPAGAIVAEPTSLRIVSANKGVLRFRIVASGSAAHSSRPELGDNAIMKMSQVLQRLESWQESLADDVHPLVGPATSCVTTIEGGRQVNIVPESCEIRIDHRLLPGHHANDIWERYAELCVDLDGVEILEPDLADEAMETRTDAIVVEVAEEVQSSLGLAPVPVGVPFGCDATKFSRAGIPSLIYGPGSIEQAHASIEFVALEEVEKAVAFYRDFLLKYPR
ncbi:MAG: M20 family metallopeptidase [Verrucomicrobiota bacterium]